LTGRALRVGQWDAIGIARMVPVILCPNRNSWRIERAERAAVLIDAACYFGALRKSLIKARSTVFVVGWDIDSRTKLVGESGRADDEYPEGFIDLLTALVNERPQLRVHLLVWDYSVLFALERELFPSISLRWRMPRQIRYCLDDDLPAGAAHHQKIVVVDDAIAFSGGQDVTIRRWDTNQHPLDHPSRIDPTGKPYAPYHDVQAIVDGNAALALAKLVRERWKNGACERAPPIRPLGDPWPAGIVPDLERIDVGIARTYPALEDQDEIRECEALFFDSVERAERAILIENQFLTATRFTERLARRMRESPKLEVVIIAPRASRSWLEGQTMRASLGRFMCPLEDPELRHRVALLSPRVTADGRTSDIMIHSKIMVVDDVLLRVGSANLNNRSFGLDTECDLAFEAKTPEQRQAIIRLRDRMLGHFCGAGPQEVAASLSRTGSLITTARSLRWDGHSLEPIDLDGAKQESLSALALVADPERPIAPPPVLQSLIGKRPSAQAVRRFAKVICIGIAIVLLILAWRFTALSALVHPDSLRQGLQDVAELPGAPLIVVAVFVVGGLVAFPVLLLIAATAAAFGPWLGFALAGAGAIASAAVTYGVGAVVGRRLMDDFLGPRVHRVRRSIVRHSILAVASVRLVPIAPFTLVNLVAGASRIPFVDYLLGTILGMAPGLVVMSALGYQIWSIFTEPTPTNVLFFLLAVLAWLALSIGAQALVLRARRCGN
jgi:phospholipase D1/2